MSSPSKRGKLSVRRRPDTNLTICRPIRIPIERLVRHTLRINYDQLLDLASELGFRLMSTGAEIYRVEESIQYLLRAYGVETGEVFAIPNCLIVSLTDTNGHASTRVRRIPAHGTDISLLESYNEFCRTISQSPPPLAEALERMDSIQRRHFVYPLPVLLLAYFVGGGAYPLLRGQLAGWTVRRAVRHRHRALFACHGLPAGATLLSALWWAKPWLPLRPCSWSDWAREIWISSPSAR